MYTQYISPGFRVMGLWRCLFCLIVLLGGILTGCRTTGLYEQSCPHLDMATQAFLTQDWPRARKGFNAMAAQTKKFTTMTAGLYGLSCVEMATATNIPSFLKALETVSSAPAGVGRFKNQNPELFILAADHGIRIMEEKLKEQADQLRQFSLEEKRSAQKIRSQEQTIKHLRHQIQVLERIDRELQEKRNPS